MRVQDDNRWRAASRALVLALLGLFSCPGQVALAAPVRLKELADVQGVRKNQLLGYGLVVGLSGTGDTERVLFTAQSVSGMLGRLGIRIDPREVRVRNVAAVMVTTTLPAFTRPGSQLDIQVSSIGNARSLSGGTLLMTPLKGADGQVYAVGQGPVQTGGYQARVAGSAFQKNQPTAGRVPGGATVERAVHFDLSDGPLVLQLKEPDFTNAARVVAAVNQLLGDGAAKAEDAAAITVTVPEERKGQVVALLGELEALEIDADQRARIVVSERTGTIVAGGMVRLRPAMVVHGSLKVAVEKAPATSQPGPFSLGQTVPQSQGRVDASEAPAKAVPLDATTSVSELADALNLLGATARDLISILQALKAAGALDAEIVVM